MMLRGLTLLALACLRTEVASDDSYQLLWEDTTFGVGRGTANSVAWNKAGTMLAAGGKVNSGEGTVVLYDPAGDGVRQFVPGGRGAPEILAVAFVDVPSTTDPSGRKEKLAVGAKEFFDEPNYLLYTVSGPFESTVPDVAVTLPFDVVDLASSEALLDAEPTPVQAAVLTHLNQVRFVEARTSSGDFLLEEPVIDPSSSSVSFPAMALHGTTLAAHGIRGLENVAALYDATTGEQLFDPVKRVHQVWSMAAAPDGSAFAIGEGGNLPVGDPNYGDRTWRVALVDPATGRVRKELFESGAWCTALAFSPDENTLAVGTESGRVRLLDLRSGSERHTFQTTSDNWIESLAFSPDGSRLAAAGRDGKVSVFAVPFVEGGSDGARATSASLLALAAALVPLLLEAT